MNSARIIPRDEFDRDLDAINRAIFTSAPFFAIANSRGLPAFVDRAWSLVPIPFDIRLDTRPSPDDRPDWPVTDDPFHYRDEYEPLFALLRGRCESEIVLTTRPHFIDPAVPILGCPPERDCLDAALDLGLSDEPSAINVFSRSADWGLCSNGEHDGYSVIAGTEAFMTDLVATYGGIEPIKRRFWEFHTKYHRLPVSDDQSWCRAWKALGWGEVPKARPEP